MVAVGTLHFAESRATHRDRSFILSNALTWFVAFKFEAPIIYISIISIRCHYYAKSNTSEAIIAMETLISAISSFSFHYSPLPCSAESQDGKDLSGNAIIMDAIKDTGENALLIFFPGAFTASDAYCPLLLMVQQKCSFRLWVVIYNPGPNSYTASALNDIDASIDGMIRRAKEHGFVPGDLPTSNVFFAGHSLGGILSRSIALKKSSGYIQMGSYFPPGQDDLVQYPNPVLTIGGGRDGQVTLAPIARHSYQVFEVQPEMGTFYTVAVKPVIIIPGMDHAQFSHGIPNKERGDIDPEISLQQARCLTASYTASFLSLNLESQATNPETPIWTLQTAVEQTRIMFGAFSKSLSCQDSEVKQWQLTVAGLYELTEENVVVIRHDYYDNFVYSKPWIDLELRRIFVPVYLSPANQAGIVKNVWVKMKSREAVCQAFQGDYSSNPDDNDVVSAKQLNSDTFQKAVSLLPEEMVMKFYKSGKKLRFVDDFMAKSGPEWLSSDVTIKAAEDSSPFVDVRSPVLITPVSVTPARFAGMQYMKLLSISRCMEWVLLDCFREWKRD